MIESTQVLIFKKSLINDFPPTLPPNEVLLAHGTGPYMADINQFMQMKARRKEEEEKKKKEGEKKGGEKKEGEKKEGEKKKEEKQEDKKGLRLSTASQEDPPPSDASLADLALNSMLAANANTEWSLADLAHLALNSVLEASSKYQSAQAVVDAAKKEPEKFLQRFKDLKNKWPGETFNLTKFVKDLGTLEYPKGMFPHHDRCKVNPVDPKLLLVPTRKDVSYIN